MLKKAFYTDDFLIHTLNCVDSLVKRNTMGKMHLEAGRIIFRRARELRDRQTVTEEKLWNYLRTRPLGYKFRRQHPVHCYILDFYCHALRLAIEVDGSVHQNEITKHRDQIRQEELEEKGLIFLRFSNRQVKSKMDEVIRRIEVFLKERTGRLQE